MIIAFKAFEIDTGGPDGEAVLAFDGDVLLAVVVRLSDLHGDLEGRWSGEACFFRRPPIGSYSSLDDVASWLVTTRSKRRA